MTDGVSPNKAFQRTAFARPLNAGVESVEKV
jgi:hypothetical protein